MQHLTNFVVLLLLIGLFISAPQTPLTGKIGTIIESEPPGLNPSYKSMLTGKKAIPIFTNYIVNKRIYFEFDTPTAEDEIVLYCLEEGKKTENSEKPTKIGKTANLTGNDFICLKNTAGNCKAIFVIPKKDSTSDDIKGKIIKFGVFRKDGSNTEDIHEISKLTNFIEVELIDDLTNTTSAKTFNVLTDDQINGIENAEIKNELTSAKNKCLENVSNNTKKFTALEFTMSEKTDGADDKVIYGPLFNAFMYGTIEVKIKEGHIRPFYKKLPTESKWFLVNKEKNKCYVGVCHQFGPKFKDEIFIQRVPLIDEKDNLLSNTGLLGTNSVNKDSKDAKDDKDKDDKDKAKDSNNVAMHQIGLIPLGIMLFSSLLIYFA